MRFARRLRRKAELFLRRSKAENDLTDELEDYVACRTERYIASGLSAEEARRAAFREIGGMEQVKEECRDVRPFKFLETLLQDLRYGAGQLRKNPGFTATVVLTLSLGVGVNATIFSAVSSMLLREPPIEQPDRVVTLLSGSSYASPYTSESSRRLVSVPDFLDWRDQATSFTAMAANSLQQFTLSGGQRPELVAGAQVTANYFQPMGVAPILGRSFTPTDDQAGNDRVALIGEDLWKGRFGADPLVIGRHLKVDGETYTVVGIMPGGFRMWFFPSQIWLPLSFSTARLDSKTRESQVLSVFGRLKPGIGESAANAELMAISKRIAAAHPETVQGRAAQLMALQKYLVAQSNAKSALLFLQATVLFVLLIACANVVNLLLARNTARQREFAIRMALGAGRFRLACQLFAECLLLSLMSAALGLALAVGGIGIMRAALNWNEYSVFMSEQLSIDRSVLLFALAISLATTFLCGLAPALQVSKRGPHSEMKEGSRNTTSGRERNRLQNALVVAELAAAVLLLAGAGIFVSAVTHVLNGEHGLNPENVLTASIRLSGKGFDTPAKQTVFFQDVLRQIARSPEALSAAVSSDLPLTFPGSVQVAVEGRPALPRETRERASYFSISPGYFSAARIPLRQGREFTWSDKAGFEPVAIVNAAFAEKFFPGQNALGQRIQIDTTNPAPVGDSARGSEIVGIAVNVDEFSGQDRPHPQVFECFLQRPQRAMNLLVRLRANPEAFASSLRQAVWNIDKDQPVTNLKTMNRVIQDSGQGDTLMTGLMAAFAGIALIMAVLGIYGLIGYLVARRTQEIGVRMALGASQGQVRRLVLWTAMSRALLGIGIGFVVSLGLPRLTAALFNGMTFQSAWILWVTPLTVAVAALASCYSPAFKASRIEPLVALRNE